MISWLRDLFTLAWVSPPLRAVDCPPCRGRGITFMDGNPVPRGHPLDANIISCQQCQGSGTRHVPVGNH